MRAAPAAIPPQAHLPQSENSPVRLHITPLRPELLPVYLGPALLQLAQNVSFHTVQTFADKGFGYIELPRLEAQKLTHKLNGTILKGSKVRIEMAKSDKRKTRAETDAANQAAEAERPAKRAKKEKSKKEPGVLQGMELPDDRKVKRGWTEPQKKGNKDKKDKKDKHQTRQQKDSKYTKEAEMLFKTKLPPVAATEVARKEKSKDKKKEKKAKNKAQSKQVVVHEFENNSKTPSFLKETKVASEKKPAVDYVDGKGWVDEDGNVVEAETGRARQRRALELVDQPTKAQKAWIDGSAKTSKDKKAKETSPVESSSSEEDEEETGENDESSEVSSEEDEEEEEAKPNHKEPPPTRTTRSKKIPEALQTTGLDKKEVHPLEALFKRAKPASGPTSTPAKKLTPIKTGFSFFESNGDNNEEIIGQTVENVPITPFTQVDFEWRGLRSAAPTPDTAAIGRRFSFDWRGNSAEADEDEEMGDAEAEHQLTQNTKANAKNKQQLPDVAEEDEEEEEGEGGGRGRGRATKQATEDGDKPESEFRKWFWENRGDLNRAWKKRRRDALKVKRLGDNKKVTGSSGRRTG